MMRRPVFSIPSTIETMLMMIEPMIAPMTVFSVKSGGKPPIVKSIFTRSAMNATRMSSAALRTNAKRPIVRSVIGNDRSLRMGFR